MLCRLSVAERTRFISTSAFDEVEVEEVCFSASKIWNKAFEVEVLLFARK